MHVRADRLQVVHRFRGSDYYMTWPDLEILVLKRTPEGYNVFMTKKEVDLLYSYIVWSGGKHFPSQAKEPAQPP